LQPSSWLSQQVPPGRWGQSPTSLFTIARRIEPCHCITTTGRYYVAGQPGNEYEVRIRNNQAGEILSVVSIDGVNAISGETADWSQTGYILNPHTSFGIKGWRKNLQRVAAFFFTELDNSYAARTGRPDNVGVIGVAVFRKKHEVGALIGDYLARNRPPAREAEARTEAGEFSEGFSSRKPRPRRSGPTCIDGRAAART
jgi:hypothetical protein